MAVEYTGEKGVNTNRGFNTISASITVTANANRAMVINLGGYIPSLAVVDSMLVNGSTALELDTLITEGGIQLNSQWGFVAPGVGTYNIVATLDLVANSLSLIAGVYRNVDQVTPFSNVNSAIAASLNVTSATDNMVVDSHVVWPENTYSTTQPGQTLVDQLNDNPGDPGTITSMSYRAGQTTTAMGWSPAGTSPSMIGVNLNAVSGGGGSVVPVLMNHYRQRR